MMPDLPNEASSTNERRQCLYHPVSLAWSSFDRAAALTSRVRPAAPILFFGDFDQYCSSPLRIVTVGLNPS